MKKIKHIQIIAGILIFIVIIIFINIRRKEGPQRSSLKITKLPKFVSVDINGMEVNSKDFRGKNLFIQFVNPDNVGDVDLIKLVYSSWKNENLEIMIITNDLERFKSKFEVDSKKTILVTKDYEKLKSMFHSSTREGDYYLFNGSGDLIDTNKNYVGYDKGVKIFLMQLVKKDYFSFSDFIEENENIRNFPWLQQIERIINNKKKEYFMISLFTSFCGTCNSGPIINAMDKFHSKNKNSFYVLSILNNDFNNEEDIKSLISQSKINYPIVIAEQMLNKKWTDLINKYREQDLTNIVFIIDKSGKILKILHPNCNCYKKFFNFLYSL